MALLKDAKEITIPTTNFRELEYIISDGSGQYIDTNYKPVSDDTIEIKMLYDVVSTEQESGMSYNVSGNPSRAFIGVQDGYGTYGRGSRAAKSSIAIAANTIVTQKIEKISNTSIIYTVNNNSITDSSLTSLNDCEYSFTICARKITDSTYDKQFLGGRVYYVKLGSARDMVPAQRKSDSVVGLYDKVNCIFYTNNGTGSFTAGPTTSENPSWNISVNKIEDANGDIIWGSQSAFPYRRLEYINFSGTEYILTNDKPTNNRYYYLNYSLGSIVNDKFIFGANGDTNTSTGAMRVTVRTSTTNAQARYGRNSSTNTSIGAVSTNVLYQNRLRIFSGFNAYFATYDTTTSSIIGSTSPSAITFTPANMYPFAIMGYNNGGTVGNMVVGKIYRYFYRIGDASGELGADCIPAQRKSDNVCGLYDTVNNIFLPMQGTNITTSAAGPLVDEYWDQTV